MKKSELNYRPKYKLTKNNIKNEIEKRYYILVTIIILLMSTLIINLFNIQILKANIYSEKIKEMTQNVIYGNTAPRGRIYDRNGKLIVDNQAVKVIYYKKNTKTTTKEEIEIAYRLSELIILDYSKLTIEELKYFWIKKHPDKANSKITEIEIQKLKERKLNQDDIQKLKLERIIEEELKILTENDKKTAYIYALMNKGYSYSEKIIKKNNVSDIEYAKVSENSEKLKGVGIKLEWNREYLYGDTFKTFLGSVSSSEIGIPLDLKDYYISKGYSLTDQVGISYLEYQYDEFLKGTKDKYELSNNNQKLIENGQRGNDIVLTIDIELQQAVEKIIVDNLIAAKREPNTEYFNKAYVIITDPKTGEILAIAGKQIVYDKGTYKVYDYSPGIITSPVTPGSVVKGASHIVGYNTGALTIGEIRNDACIKIASTPEKCSWMYLGTLDDISALKYSSNTYQFNTAIKVGKGNYGYNMPLKLDEKAYDVYRKTFAEFGLGVKTEIDLPIESLGFKGNSTVSGHLLDFAIGQYDTYTPIQISQYISTIANNGTRLKPFLLKAVYSSTSEPLTKKIYETETTILNKVTTTEKYLNRVKDGLKTVLEPYGTGYYFIDPKYKPAGKTGTSQSFIDTDFDNKIDTETITTTFAAYAPYDNPKVTFTVISPDVSHYNNYSVYQSNVNSRIAYQVSQKYFEIFK